MDARKMPCLIWDVLDDSDYVQYLVSQSRCPILARKRTPVWRGVDGSARTRNAWAKFVMCNFVPWDIEQPRQIRTAAPNHLEQLLAMGGTLQDCTCKLLGAQSAFHGCPVEEDWAL